MLTVRVTRYQQRSVQGICDLCKRWLFKKRWVAWSLGLATVMASLIVASFSHRTGIGLFGVGVFVIMVFGAFYGVLDSLVWGRDVVRRLDLPRGRYHVPASVGHVLARTLLAPWVAAIVMASFMAVLEKLFGAH